MKFLAKLGKKFVASLLFASLVIASGLKMPAAALAYVIPGLVAIYGLLAGAHCATDVMATKTVTKKTETEEEGS